MFPTRLPHVISHPDNSIPDRGQDQELACSMGVQWKLYPGKARFAVAYWFYQAGTSYVPSAHVCMCAHTC